MLPPPVPFATGRLRRVTDWEALAKDSYYSSQQLAALCDVSLRHLQRHFKNHYALQLGAWLSELRLAHAYQLLLEGRRVKEVAFSLGFKQLSHFSREFKRYHGITPSTLLDSTWPKAKTPFVPRVYKTPAPDQMKLF